MTLSHQDNSPTNLANVCQPLKQQFLKNIDMIFIEKWTTLTELLFGRF
jgi:hypothetical protein